jgi:hypothetical protein
MVRCGNRRTRRTGPAAPTIRATGPTTVAHSPVSRNGMAAVGRSGNEPPAFTSMGSSRTPTIRRSGLRSATLSRRRERCGSPWRRSSMAPRGDCWPRTCGRCKMRDIRPAGLTTRLTPLFQGDECDERGLLDPAHFIIAGEPAGHRNLYTSACMAAECDQRALHSARWFGAAIVAPAERVLQRRRSGPQGRLRSLTRRFRGTA